MIYIYIHEVCGNSSTWAHVRLHINGTNELKSAQKANKEGNISGHNEMCVS